VSASDKKKTTSLLRTYLGLVPMEVAERQNVYTGTRPPRRHTSTCRPSLPTAPSPTSGGGRIGGRELLPLLPPAPPFLPLPPPSNDGSNRGHTNPATLPSSPITMDHTAATQIQLAVGRSRAWPPTTRRHRLGWTTGSLSSGSVQKVETRASHAREQKTSG
jgi:hypothetical protein